MPDHSYWERYDWAENSKASRYRERNSYQNYPLDLPMAIEYFNDAAPC